jgi:hypothetical protein
MFFGRMPVAMDRVVLGIWRVHRRGETQPLAAKVKVRRRFIGEKAITILKRDLV